jgi:hypothetical protein
MGSPSCTRCDAGSFASVNQTKCQQCSPGQSGLRPTRLTLRPAVLPTETDSDWGRWLAGMTSVTRLTLRRFKDNSDLRHLARLPLAQLEAPLDCDASRALGRLKLPLTSLTVHPVGSLPAVLAPFASQATALTELNLCHMAAPPPDWRDALPLLTGLRRLLLWPQTERAPLTGLAAALTALTALETLGTVSGEAPGVAEAARTLCGGGGVLTSVSLLLHGYSGLATLDALAQSRGQLRTLRLVYLGWDGFERGGRLLLLHSLNLVCACAVPALSRLMRRCVAAFAVVKRIRALPHLTRLNLFDTLRAGELVLQLLEQGLDKHPLRSLGLSLGGQDETLLRSLRQLSQLEQLELRGGASFQLIVACTFAPPRLRHLVIVDSEPEAEPTSFGMLLSLSKPLPAAAASGKSKSKGAPAAGKGDLRHLASLLRARPTALVECRVRFRSLAEVAEHPFDF